MTAVAEKLREAKALIKRGWCQKAFWNGDGSVCALGAIEKVTGNAPAGIQFLRPLAKAIGEPFDFGKYSRLDLGIVSWNDNSRRTQAEVLAAFDRAIKLAESGQ